MGFYGRAVYELSDSIKKINIKDVDGEQKTTELWGPNEFFGDILTFQEGNSSLIEITGTNEGGSSPIVSFDHGIIQTKQPLQISNRNQLYLNYTAKPNEIDIGTELHFFNPMLDNYGHISFSETEKNHFTFQPTIKPW